MLHGHCLTAALTIHVDEVCLIIDLLIFLVKINVDLSDITFFFNHFRYSELIKQLLFLCHYQIRGNDVSVFECMRVGFLWLAFFNALLLFFQLCFLDSLFTLPRTILFSFNESLPLLCFLQLCLFLRICLLLLQSLLRCTGSLGSELFELVLFLSKFSLSHLLLYKCIDLSVLHALVVWYHRDCWSISWNIHVVTHRGGLSFTFLAPIKTDCSYLITWSPQPCVFITFKACLR